MGLIRKMKLMPLAIVVWGGFAWGQQVETGISLFPGLAHSAGLEWGMNGFALDLSYLQQMDGEFQLKGGLEAGITGWGSQVLLAAGVRKGDVNQVEVEILNGMALYKGRSPYVFGLGSHYVRHLAGQRKHRLLLSAGLRFTLQPAYREYSDLFFYIDLPLQIRWGLNLD